MRVNIIYNKIPHHAGRSGYDQILRHLQQRIDVDNLPGDIPRFVPMWAMEWVASQASMEWYSAWSVALEGAAARRLLSHRGELCHALYGENDYRFLGSIAPLLRRRGARLVCSYHQPPALFEKVAPPRKVLRQLDAVVAVASNQADYFSSMLGEDRVFVVPHGIDTTVYTPATHANGRRFECLFVGQWLRDFEVLAGVVERVRAAEPEIVFTVVTDPGNAERLERLDGVQARSGVSDDELLALYRRASLFVLPLTDCTANNALLEALACGLPIVTTDVGGVRDYVDESCAVVTPAGEADAMAEAVLELATDAPRLAAMAVCSRERALDYDWPAVADRIVGVYREVGS